MCHIQNRRQFLKKGVKTSMAIGGCLCLPPFTVAYSQNSQEDKNKFKMIAYCTLDCSICEAYLATINNDDDLREKVAKNWKMDKEDINCLGCKSEKRLGYECTILPCAEKKKVYTCAHCDTFEKCENPMWKKWPKLRERAEEYRKSLES